MPTIAPASEPAGTAAGGGRPEPELHPAGLLRRLGAMLYDGLLMLAIWMLTLFPMVALAGAAVAGPAVRALLFLELYAFFTFFWVRRGQTLGMLAWRLRVQSDDGGGLTLSQATRRFVAAALSFVCLGLGYLWIWIDPGRRSWSDLLSGSRVLYLPKSPR